MKGWLARLVWLATGAAIVVGVLLFLRRDDEGAALARAVSRGEIAISARAEADGGEFTPGDAAAIVRLTVTRGSGSHGHLYYVLPAGRRIGDADGGFQALVTAAPIVINLPDDLMTQEVQVPVYCLDPFKPPPGPDQALDVQAGPPPDDEGVELAKLADCLQDEGSPQQRQLAVWIVSRGFLEKSQDEVRNVVETRTLAVLEEQMEAALAGRLARRGIAVDDQVRARLSALRGDLVDAQLAERAKAVADQLMAGLASARPRLDACGYATGQLAFFAGL